MTTPTPTAPAHGRALGSHGDRRRGNEVPKVQSIRAAQPRGHRTLVVAEAVGRALPAQAAISGGLEPLIQSVCDLPERDRELVAGQLALIP